MSWKRFHSREGSRRKLAFDNSRKGKGEGGRLWEAWVEVLPFGWNCSLLYRRRGAIRLVHSAEDADQLQQPKPLHPKVVGPRYFRTRGALGHPCNNSHQSRRWLLTNDLCSRSSPALPPFVRLRDHRGPCRRPTRNSLHDAASTWVRRVCGIFAIGSHNGCMLSRFIDWVRKDRRGR